MTVGKRLERSEGGSCAYRMRLELQAGVNSKCRSTDVGVPGVIKERREGQHGLSGEELVGKVVENKVTEFDRVDHMGLCKS